MGTIVLTYLSFTDAPNEHSDNQLPSQLGSAAGFCSACESSRVNFGILNLTPHRQLYLNDSLMIDQTIQLRADLAAAPLPQTPTRRGHFNDPSGPAAPLQPLQPQLTDPITRARRDESELADLLAMYDSTGIPLFRAGLVAAMERTAASQSSYEVCGQEGLLSMSCLHFEQQVARELGRLSTPTARWQLDLLEQQRWIYQHRHDLFSELDLHLPPIPVIAVGHPNRARLLDIQQEREQARVRALHAREHQSRLLEQLDATLQRLPFLHGFARRVSLLLLHRWCCRLTWMKLSHSSSLMSRRRMKTASERFLTHGTSLL